MSSSVQSVSQCSDSDATQNSSSSGPPPSFQALEAASNKSVSKLTAKTKIFPIIKEQFHHLYKHDSKNVLEIFKSMMNQLDTMIKEEIEILLDSSNVEQLLKELDTIKQNSVKGSKTWRPSGNPEEDLIAHYEESSEMELEHLEKIHAALLSKNKWLNECVQKSSSRVSSSMKVVDHICKGWDENVSVITKDAQEKIVDITSGFSDINFLEEEC